MLFIDYDCLNNIVDNYFDQNFKVAKPYGYENKDMEIDQNDEKYDLEFYQKELQNELNELVEEEEDNQESEGEEDEEDMAMITQMSQIFSDNEEEGEDIIEKTGNNDENDHILQSEEPAWEEVTWAGDTINNPKEIREEVDPKQEQRRVETVEKLKQLKIIIALSE